MRSVALKGLAGRKVRALLTAFAIVIGVAMVSGTFILTDTMQASFDGIFKASYSQTDAVVAGKEVVKNSMSHATMPESLLGNIRKLDEVGAAAGTVTPYEANSADIIGDDGKAVAMESTGGSYDQSAPGLSPLKLKTGKWANGSEQVVIDAGTAKKEHYKLGDTVVISTAGVKHNYKLTGTASFGGVDSLGFASVAVWDTKTAQKLLHREGRFDQISIAAKKGTTPEALVKAVQPLLPQGLEVKDSKKQAASDADDFNEGMGFLKKFLLAFGGIALLVGAFVIFNTLSITVAQRTREFATLRTLGGSRKQVMRSVKTEGVAIGLLASVIGLVFGLGIAKGMIWLFSALGVDLPDGGTVFATRTVIVSLILGTVITLVASIVPARRATRIPPIAAVREGSTLPKSRRSAATSRYTAIGVLAASAAALTAGSFAPGISGNGIAALLSVGMLGLFVGIALVAPGLVKPLARVVGWPARRVGGVAGDLAGANSVRNPGRTASTAAALMIGLTLVTLVAVLGAGIRGATQTAVSDQLHADYVVDGDVPFRANEGEELASQTGVTAASHVRSDSAIVHGKESSVSGIDPATIATFYTFDWSKGSSAQSLAKLGSDGALVTESYAKKNHLAIGSRLDITTPSSNKLSVVVRGIYDPPAIKKLLDPVNISSRAFDGAFPEPKNKYTFLNADSNADAGIRSAAKGFGDADLHTGAAYPKDSTKDLDTVLAFLYVLLGFSVIVSLFGMVNTMVLSVFERTRELGMLRTIGMTRRQARRMIRHESIITALIGAALGLGLGTFLAAVITNATADNGIRFSLPVQTLAGFTLIAVLAGIGAAIAPARRASKLNVLQALQYE